MSAYVNAMSRGFATEMRKIARARMAKQAGAGIGKLLGSKWVIGPAAGVLGWEALKKMEKDRRMGREIRMRSKQGY